jgi:hypothetical protein
LFERPHHRRVATVLLSLDGRQLASQGCLFGGGTAIALRYGEFRESVDIDFLVSHAEGYRTLRQWLTGPEGLNSITRPGASLGASQPVRADQYGIRTRLRVEAVEIKFEIVREARIELAAPGEQDQLCGVATLTPLDMASSKLLANSDRWADRAVYSRDLIDLAMMRPSKSLLREAIFKARKAYGDSIEADLAKAIARLRENPQHLGECMRTMGMTTVPRAVLWSRIKALEPRAATLKAATGSRPPPAR